MQTNYQEPSVIERILSTSKTIAVVGLSSQPGKAGHYVPAYLQSQGYKIVPVNPTLDQALGEKSYPDLLAGMKEFNRDVYQTAKGSNMNSTTVVAAIRFTHAPSGTFIDVEATGEGADSGEWVLMDFGQVVVHIVQPSIREDYNLEQLWGGVEAARRHGQQMAEQG